MDEITVTARLPTDSDTVAEISITKNKWNDCRRKPTSILEIVDTSASMYCSNCTQNLFCEFCRFDHKSDYSKNPAGVLEKILIRQPPAALLAADKAACRRRIIFGGTAKLVKTHGAVCLECLGATNFNTAFALATETIVTNRLNDVHVLFLTDGRSNTPLCTATLNNFANSCQEFGATVHLLGYGVKHDINAMETLLGSLNSINVPTTFDFAKTPEDIETFVQDYASVLSYEPQEIKLTVILDDQSTEQFNLIYIDKNETQLVYVPVPAGRFIASIDIDGTSTEFKIQNACAISARQSELAYMATKASTGPELKALDQMADDIETDLLTQRKTIDRVQHQALRRSLTEFRQIVNQRYADLAGGIIVPAIAATTTCTNSTATTESRAAMLMAQHGVKKKSLVRRLGRIIIDNGDMTSRDEAAITAAVATLNTLTTTAANLDDFVDPISFSNWAEAAASGTCLCLCLSIDRRSGTAIADPSQLSIIDVVPQYVTYSTFEDLCDGQVLDLDNITFQRGKAMFKNTQGLHKFNAVMPIYADDDHWKVASIYLKWTVAHMCTSTKEGYKPSQLYTVPLLILEFMARTPKRTEAVQRAYDQVLKVCQMIEKRNTDSLDEHLVSFDAFQVTRSIVPSCQIIVGRAIALGRDFNRNINLFAEEVRRRFRPPSEFRSEAHVTSQILDLLDMDVKSLTILNGLDNEQIRDGIFGPAIDSLSLNVNLIKLKSAFARLQNWIVHFDIVFPDLESTIVIWALHNSLRATNIAFQPDVFSWPTIVRRRIRDHIDACQDNARLLIEMAKQSNNNDHYIRTNSVVPPFITVVIDERGVQSFKFKGNHVHGAGHLGRLLVACRANKGNIVNGNAKLDFLLKFVQLGKRNRSSFY